MNKQSAISLALQVQTRKRDNVAVQLTSVHLDLDTAKAQLAQLHQYARDTGGAWARSGEIHGTARMQHHEPFMQKLKTATDFQGETITMLERRIASLRVQLIAAAQRIAALESLQEEYKAQERFQAQRHEQRATDEMASIRYARRDSAAAMF